jgi:hypothetical protein
MQSKTYFVLPNAPMLISSFELCKYLENFDFLCTEYYANTDYRWDVDLAIKVQDCLI